MLLLPGDTFATRAPHPVLQQLEVPHDGTVSVNDCFRPVSRYFDRITRPEQIVPAALEAMRVLTDPAETGAVTLALPEDVQTEAFEVPDAFLEPRVWTVFRRPPAPDALARAASLVREARRPLIVAGGGVIYAEATEELRALAEATGIPVCETQAGRGALPSEHPSALGAVGATGTLAANRLAREADLVIGVGTRWSDFTTASKSAFQDPGVRFVNVNVASLDAAKHSGLALEADAKLALAALAEALAGHRVDEAWERRAADEARAWGEEVERLTHAGHAPLPSQAEVIGAVNEAAGPRDVVVCAAGSMPGDLHKLWRARDPKGYHVEYGYSCMGYELPGGMGVKLAAPDREVFVMVGDGSWLMAPGDLVTAVAEGIKIVVVLVDNHGYASIGALSRSIGDAGFGTHYRRSENGAPVLDAPAGDGPAGELEALPIDLGASAEALGARLLRARGVDELREALSQTRRRRAARSSCTWRWTATPACRATRAGGTCRWPRSPRTPPCARRARSTSARGRASGATWRASNEPAARAAVADARPGWQPDLDHAGDGGLGARGFRGGVAGRGPGQPSAAPASASCAWSSCPAPCTSAPSTASGSISAAVRTRSRACPMRRTCRRGPRSVCRPGRPARSSVSASPRRRAARPRGCSPARRSRWRCAGTVRSSGASIRS